MSKQFHIGDILSITTERMVAPTGIDAVYAILGFMTSDTLFTHQLPRAGRECRPWLLRKYPDLADVDASGVTFENWKEWIAEQEIRFGSYLPVDPIPMDDHDRIDPVEELASMVGEDRVVVVAVDPTTDQPGKSPETDEP